jgi:tetratricopeptide (TPR) repeat protein
MDTQDYFTDRVEAVKAFNHFIDPRNDDQVLAYWGVAGQGKSTLLRHLAGRHSYGYHHQLIDLEDVISTYPTPDRSASRDYATELLAQLADALLPRSGLFGSILRKRYRHARGSAEALLRPGDTHASIEATRGGTVTDSVVYVDSRFEAGAHLRSAYRQHQVEALADAARLTRRRRLVMFVDTSEWLWLLDGIPEASAGSDALPVGWWFTHQVLPQILSASGAKVVLGGRERLTVPDTVRTRHFELSEWAQKDTAAYLNSRGIRGSGANEAIHEFCGGVPVWVSMVADILSDGFQADGLLDFNRLSALAVGRPAEVWLPEVLLSRVDPALKVPLLYASVLKALTTETVTVMARGQKLPEDWLDRLLRYSFVQRHRLASGRSEIKIHYLVQTALREHLRSHDPTLLLELNERAASYYQSCGDLDRYAFHALASGDDKVLFEFQKRISQSLSTGHFDECLINSAGVIAQVPADAPGEAALSLLAMAHLANGIIYSAQQRYGQARSELSEAHRQYLACRNTSGQAAVLRAQAEVAGRQNDVRTAVDLAEKALHLGRRSGDKRAEAESLLELGERLHLQQGTARRAAQYLRHSATLFEQLHDAHGNARALLWLGEQARVAHRVKDATRLLVQAQNQFAASQDQIGSAIVLCQLGELLVQHGELDEGRKKLFEALNLFESQDSLAGVHGRATAYRSLAQSAVIRGEPDADEYLRKAFQLFLQTSDKQAQGHVLRLHGQLALSRGDEELAARYFTETKSLYRQASDEIGAAHVSMLLGEIALRRGADARGVKLVTEAYVAYQKLGDPLGEGNTLHILGDAALRSGDLIMAQRRLSNALHKHEAAGDILATAHDRVSLAELALVKGNTPLARKYINAAVDIYERQRYRMRGDRVSRILRQISRAS